MYFDSGHLIPAASVSPETGSGGFLTPVIAGGGVRPLRVALVEDNPLFRDLLPEALATAGGFEVVAGYPNGEAALAAAPWEGVDLLITDLELPGISGVRVVEEAKRLRPELPVAVWTVYATKNLVIKAMHAGAGGYLVKDTPVSELAAALRVIASGGGCVSSRIMPLLFEGAAVPVDPALAEAEGSVLRFLADRLNRCDLRPRGPLASV